MDNHGKVRCVMSHNIDFKTLRYLLKDVNSCVLNGDEYAGYGYFGLRWDLAESWRGAWSSS